MMVLWAFLVKSKLGRYLAVAVSAIIAVITFGQLQKRKGKKDALTQAREADHENAREIRDHAESESNIADRMRKYDDSGFRD